MTPDRSRIIKWTLQEYDEIEPSLVKKGNFIIRLTFNFKSF